MAVIALVPPKDTEIHDKVVKLLEELLGDARAGKIDTVMGVYHRTGEGWSEFASATAILSEAIGRLEILKHVWIAEYLRADDG